MKQLVLLVLLVTVLIVAGCQGQSPQYPDEAVMLCALKDLTKYDQWGNLAKTPRDISWLPEMLTDMPADFKYSTSYGISKADYGECLDSMVSRRGTKTVDIDITKVSAPNIGAVERFDWDAIPEDAKLPLDTPYHEVYPVRFRLPGYNAKGDIAMVQLFIDDVFDPHIALCVLKHKKNGEWHVAHRQFEHIDLVSPLSQPGGEKVDQKPKSPSAS